MKTVKKLKIKDKNGDIYEFAGGGGGSADVVSYTNGAKPEWDSVEKALNGIIDKIDYEKLLRFKKASVKFYTQPYKYKKDENKVVLDINQEIRDAIVLNKRKEELRRLAYSNDHATTLLQDGLMKVINGDTSFDEIVRIIDIDDDLGEDETDIKNALLGKTELVTADDNDTDYEVL